MDQLTNYGKLYVARGGDPFGMSVIATNEKGPACLYQDRLLEWTYDYNNLNSFVSFPTFIASYFNSTTTIEHSFDCFSATVQFSLHYATSKSEKDITKIHWYFDDKTERPSDESEEVNPVHTFKAAGLHTIRATILWADGTRQELKQLLPIPPDVVQEKRFGLGQDTTICPGLRLG